MCRVEVNAVIDGATRRVIWAQWVEHVEWSVRKNIVQFEDELVPPGWGCWNSNVIQVVMRRIG